MNEGISPVKSPTRDGVLIIDYGSQTTLLIARRLREMGIYCEVHPPSVEWGRWEFEFEPRGLILSGGPSSTVASAFPVLPAWFELSHLPTLGICYGMQLLARTYGGITRSSVKREFGRESLKLLKPEHEIFQNIPRGSIVWMSHGDDVEECGQGFEILAVSGDNETMAVMADKSHPVFGVQFHPEVVHSECGTQLLHNFVEKFCGFKRGEDGEDLLGRAHAYLSKIDQVEKILVAVSGGVDSTVAAAVLTQFYGEERVTLVFVDHGLLRADEAEEVQVLFKSCGFNNLVVLNRSEQFLSALAGETDPEKKRKIVGRCFIDVFQDFVEKSGEHFSHLAQGTLYPDVVESSSQGDLTKVIKSHHNVGGLPDTLRLKLIEPFRLFFKDEVRRLGRNLKLPEKHLMRHPFPGPGLSIRVLGEVTEEKCDILRKVDRIYIDCLRARGLYSKIWQAFATLLPVKTVGVMGDDRTYEWVCALRAVTAEDGMTASAYPFDMEFLSWVSDKIVREVRGVNRVVYDVTSKPPGTIEWE